MISALATIEIYKPTYYTRVVGGETQIVRSRYQNLDDSTYNFPVTDSCERSATVMADDYVKLQFKLLHQIPFDAFAYIWYDGQLFFLKEDYRPTDKGSHFEYQMKFVSVANMLDKSLALRYLTSVQTDPEPEINMNGTLEDMAAIVMGAIGGAATRLTDSRPVGSFPLFYVYTLQHLTLADDILQNTALETFSFSGQNIADVLTQLCNTYQTEWWISQESLYSTKLHLCRCEKGDTLPLSDTYKQTTNKLKPYQSRGLLSCEYSQEWSNVPQILIPYGSERNITRQQALENVNGNDMYVSYGKQLRLAPNTTYNVKDREGNTVQVTTNALGAFVNTNKTGIETIKNFDDIYPRCHFRVIGLRQEGTPEHPIYTMTAGALKADGQTVMTYAEMVADGLLPLQIEPNETLSVRFESGYLNGREFEVRHDIKEETVDINGTPTTIMRWLLTIVPEEGGDDGVSLPFGNFVPRPVSGTYEGDMFAIFHMVMPTAYVNRAREELAQAAYDELLAIEDTRPEVKCKTDPDVFRNETITLGQRVAVYSELFGTITYDQAGDIAQDSGGLFASRVTSFQHSLTKPTTIEFKLASACVEGRLASIEAVIADRTSDIRGLEQRSLNLSRRGWHDAAEMKDMLETLAAEMMLVGVEKNQFGFTMAIQSVGGNMVSGVDHFLKLAISAGYIQHTQEPYIKYTNQGKWEVNAADLTTDINGEALDATKPYYLYAYCPAAGTTATMYLSLAALDNADPSTLPAGTGTDYLLLGILSSEFLDDLPTPNTSYRVFNRSNGYTQITGGTITTEQIQDPTRSLIIDFASNPPRIIARQDAQIIGNISFYAADGTVEDAETFVNNRIGAIGGENFLYIHDYSSGQVTCEEGEVFTYYEELTYYSGSGASRQHTLLPAGKYVFSAEDAYMYVEDNHADIRLYIAAFNSSGQEVATAQIPLGFSYQNRKKVRDVKITTSVPCYFCMKMVCDGTDMQQWCSGDAGAKKMQLQNGERSTEYNNYMEHLSNAIKGTTDIFGGLLMTNVMMLKNEQGAVTAGMSGLSGTALNPEKVLMWGGGTYINALYAALHDYYMASGSSSKITTLLKKDGTGKIGVFYIESDKAVVRTPDGQVVIDDDEGISCILPDDSVAVQVTPKELPTLSSLMNAETVSGTVHFEDGGIEHTKRVETREPNNTIWVDGESFDTEIYMAAEGTASIKITAWESQYATTPMQVPGLDTVTQYLYVRITDPNGNETNYTLTNNVQKTYTPTVTGTYLVEYWVRFKFEFTQADEYSFFVTYDEQRDYATVVWSYTRAHKQTMLAKGGMFTFQGDKSYLYYKDGYGFDCRVGDNRLKISASGGIEISGLGTDPSSSIGRLYRDSSGYLKIKI